MTPPIVAVVGPTASGKTALAVDVALALGGEIVNADAFQLYRGMDVGTAKPTLAERRGVPHHLVADGALTGGPFAVRRTRAGDAWEQRTRQAPAGVSLGMPALRRA